MRGPWVTVGLWLIAPPAAGSAVWLLGEAGSLGWPPIPADWPEWIAAEGPAVVFTATLRLAAVSACAITTIRVIVAVLCVALPGSMPRRHRRRPVSGSLARALGRIARPAAMAGLGVSLFSTPGFAAGAAATDDRISPASDLSSPVADRGDRVARVVDVAPAESEPDGSFAQMRRVRFEFAALDALDPGSPGATEWVVARGDHLWSIAEETLADHLGAPPSERRIARYWLRLIETNRHRLVVPGEPDLILPGQRLVLPPPGAGPAQRSGT